MYKAKDEAMHLCSDQLIYIAMLQKYKIPEMVVLFEPCVSGDKAA